MYNTDSTPFRRLYSFEHPLAHCPDCLQSVLPKLWRQILNSNLQADGVGTNLAMMLGKV
jgi:hypothetical protein